MKATLPKYVTIRTDIYYLLMPSYVCCFVLVVFILTGKDWINYSRFFLAKLDERNIVNMSFPLIFSEKVVT